jgi:uncharacterized membrane protein YhaH (DUF805 family)
MALPHHYAIALVHPGGRISPPPFAALAIGLFVVNWYSWRAIMLGQQTDPYGPYTIALLAAMWSTFCLLSRRLHDTGSNGIFLIPLLGLSVVTFMIAIDPELFGVSDGDTDGLAMLAEHGRRIARLLGIAIFVYCVRAAGEEGPNAYGPEFGDTEESGPLRAGKGQREPVYRNEAERRRAAVVRARPADPYAMPEPAAPAAAAPSRRAQGFGRR